MRDGFDLVALALPPLPHLWADRHGVYRVGVSWFGRSGFGLIGGV